MGPNLVIRDVTVPRSATWKHNALAHINWTTTLSHDITGEPNSGHPLWTPNYYHTAAMARKGSTGALNSNPRHGRLSDRNLHGRFVLRFQPSRKQSSFTLPDNCTVRGLQIWRQQAAVSETSRQYGAEGYRPEHHGNIVPRGLRHPELRGSMVPRDLRQIFNTEHHGSMIPRDLSLLNTTAIWCRGLQGKPSNPNITAVRCRGI